MATIADIAKVVSDFNLNEKRDRRVIDELQKEFDSSIDKQRLKILRGTIIPLRTALNQYILDTQAEISIMLIDYLFSLENMKVDNMIPDQYYDDVKWCFVTLADSQRILARYFKMPKSWILLGFLAGVLEDLVVVMRTVKQMKISSNHLVTIDTLITGYNNYIQTETDGSRFPFLTKLFAFSTDQIVTLLKTAINSQGKARRIAFYNDSNDGQTYYYAIQGLLGGVAFDPRVVRILTPDNTPPFAVHFTVKEVALSIWTKQKTTPKRPRTNGLPIPIGAICKFDRPIHALTNIEFDGTYYKIVTSDKDIRDRMNCGIKDDNVRPKYESGLVIDLRKLVSMIEPGKVQINEIGTLLVSDDIPHECLLDCINTDDKLEHFWGV